MILEGRYSPKIRNWKKFSELMSLYQSFHELKEKLGRTPTYMEFEKEFKKIRKLNPKIKTYNHFLEYMGIKPKKICGYWTQEKIKKAYYELKQALKRTPTRREFREKYPGAYSAIRRFNFDSSVKAYNEFLKKMGEVPVRHEKNYWTPERIKEAYHKLMKELGRSPRNTEFQSRYSGAYNAILKGKFDANIKTYKDFVENFKAETVFNASPTIEIDPSRIILVHGHK
jgi:GTP cyclohydrolase I